MKVFASSVRRILNYTAKKAALPLTAGSLVRVRPGRLIGDFLPIRTSADRNPIYPEDSENTIFHFE